jgi:transcriptional regulator with XRE-family HTH domain
MIDESTLGDMVRERRLAAGYSLGQLASKVGRTAAVVREWERGEGYPDPDLVERLAETLEIDLGEIAALLPAPATSPAPTAPVPEPAAGPQTAPEAPPDVAPAGSDDVPQMDDDLDLGDVWAEADTDIDIDVAAVPDADAVAAVADEAPAGIPAGVPVLDLADAPTEAIFPPVGAAFPVPQTEVAVPANTVTIPPRRPMPWDAWLDPFRALFDPKRRWLYWIRAALTIAVFVVLLMVLAWAVKELFSALSELLDSIEPSDTTDQVVGLVIGGLVV